MKNILHFTLITCACLMLALQSHSIIGGTPIDDVKLKSMIVQVYIQSSQGLIGCSGSYVGNNKIVTAAHCIHGDLKAISVAFINSNLAAGGFGCAVESEHEHEDYMVTPQWWFDVAVLKINCGLGAQLLTNSFSYGNNLALLDTVNFAGFGDTGIGVFNPFPNIYSRQAAKVNLKQMLWDPEVDSLTSLPVIKEMDQMVDLGLIDCYSSTMTQGNWIGDSGGPTYIQNADQTYTLVGINSVVLGKNIDGASMFATCSTNIGHYKSWIDSIP
jgi:hypothetical protein